MSSRFGSLLTPIRKVGSATVVVLVLAAGLGLAGPTVAGAKTPPPTASDPAGSYTATLFAPKETSFSTPLTLTAKGHFSFKDGPKGTWTEAGTALTLTGTFQKTSFVFTITQRGVNLGSKAHPGKLTADGTPDAKWYAVSN
jgi:hypothetical protein